MPNLPSQACRASHRRAQRLLRSLSGRRSYHFASPSYVSSFGGYPHVDVASLRRQAVDYLEHFRPETWFEDPVCTVLKSTRLTEGSDCATVDAFGRSNGRQILATPQTVDAVLRHVQQLRPPKDLREAVRRVEKRMLEEHAAKLIGNQAMDFHKQDGVTEIEESLEANVVERKLNDLLLEDEQKGRVRVQRQVALVGCVSNFSNFLDLCRKTLRNLELGVPVLVLSRSNTTQHMYRWVQLLLEEMEKEGLDTGLVSYVSCSIEEQRRIMAQLKESPLYLTGSREVAAAIKELMPHTFASTGGPNTMVAPSLDGETEAAARMSATIENSGQCTAMRHLVTDACAPADLERIFREVSVTESSAESLRRGAFDGLFRDWARSFQVQEGYATQEATKGAQPLAYRISEGLAPNQLEEHWRRVYLDVSTPPAGSSVRDPGYLARLSRWLTTEQPITLAVNGDQEGFPMMRQLFASTAQAIYSVGRPGQPALTAQARPQDGEIFGEFPPRAEMQRYTEGPVFVPSSTPSYMARYEAEHLKSAAARYALPAGLSRPELKGYAVLLAEYLKESCGPRRGVGQRTTLWGLQRPPLREVSTVMRVEAGAELDAVLLHLMPFLLTNAQEGLVVSMAPDCSDEVQQALRAACADVPCELDSEEAFHARCQRSEPWNVVTPRNAEPEELPLVDHFVLRLLPMGHIKSSKANDEDFVTAFSDSEKWLRYRA